MHQPRPVRGDADIFGTFASPCRWIDAAGALQPTTPCPARTRCLATLTLLRPSCVPIHSATLPQALQEAGYLAQMQDQAASSGMPTMPAGGLLSVSTGLPCSLFQLTSAG